ncbi:alkaline phosphatase family protein [Novosphingobium sp. FGD1]|jgi:predicted AlkP superfamily pyrophosphatase or phosphodiesterase|uniref:Alkaline phosphatase n=1 Tax=Novosphingobium silvae TaxID=2692619 RepID=A0A7X4GF81_9SPHN|nr:alkaline phosphatase family protein [Novosphingobium silvae]MYL97545.1 alkaline phosphatase family protein [Novosphingobium silvae]
MRPFSLSPSLSLAFSSLAVALSLGCTAPAFAHEDEPATATTAATITAATAEQAPATPPKLIVAIAVDQYSADLFQQYRERYTKGLSRLLQGAVFPSGFQSHAATETCPGHSTLLTGVHPNRTGIVANNWFVPGIARADKQVYCSEDETNPKSNSEDSVISPDHLKAPTLGDLLKKKNPASLNVAVSAKDRAVVMMSGHTADAAYWLKGKGFTSFEGRKLSPAALAQNEAMARTVAAGAGDLPVPGWCGAVDRPTDMGGFTIGTYRFPLKAGDMKGFSNSPRMDVATTELAVRMLDEMPLGKDAVPDVLSVSYSATDKVGHAYGNEGVEMCIQMNVLDQTIGTLLDALDSRGLDYVVVLSADHGGADAPERMRLQGVPEAARLDEALTDEGLSASVSRATGVVPRQGPLFYGAGGSGDVWVNAGLSARDHKAVVAELVSQLKANPQISGVYTADELRKVKVPSGHPQDWTEIERVAASFDPERSGEVLMMTKRAVVPGTRPRPGYTATHGSPWDYDRRVPMLFWRKGMVRMEQAQPVETVDIAPTLAGLIDLSEPAGTWDGRCLDIYAGEADSCSR